MSGPTALIVLTGLSGAGKSASLDCLEDVGYYCVDNLPPALIETFVDLCDRAEAITRAALVVDVRTHAFLEEFERVQRALRQPGRSFHLIFLDADDSILQHRFSETRRPHPVAEAGEVSEGIRLERERLSRIRPLADRVIDTSRFTPGELREFVAGQFGGGMDRRINISVISFGYRSGLPENADLVFDVRFLPNPNYVPELKLLTGMDSPVAQFVESQPETRRFLRQLKDLLSFLIPQYAREGKSYLTIAFGCTAGRHRSATIAGGVARYLEERGHRVSLSHRDIPRMSEQ